jgi:hypothetical protein
MPTRPVPAPPEFAGLSLRPSASWLVQQADVCCYLCGELCGVAEWRPQDRPLRAVTFRRGGHQEPVRLPLVRLRCPRCQGPVYLDQPRSVRVWDDQVNWALEQPRRGRPPNWLVSLRGDAA